ncbi:serine hydrolase domain-containing protein [Nakamurella endophytica]|nr:serine hydrolase domain-containing protein [Nakamurella endophytica]
MHLDGARTPVDGSGPAAAVRAVLAVDGGPPGAVVASAGGRGGAGTDWCADGFADLGGDGRPAVPMDLSVRTDLGSVTKVVGTTTALMVLVDRGEVGLDDRAGRYLPALATTPVGAARISDLLQHRAGLWEWWPLYLEDGPPLSTAAGLPLRYRSGAARHYSDLGFMVLGAVVAAVAGCPLGEAVARLVTGPLGLTTTTAGAPAPGGPVAASSAGDVVEREMVATGRPYPVTPTAAAPLGGWRRHVLVGEVNDGNAFHAWGARPGTGVTAGHAGLFSTVSDLVAVGAAWLDSLCGDGPLGRDTVRAFFTAGPDPTQALGLRVWPGGPAGPVLGHTGFPGVAVGVVPRLHRTVVLVTNRLHGRPTPVPTEQLWQRALAAVLPGRDGPDGPVAEDTARNGVRRCG